MKHIVKTLIVVTVAAAFNAAVCLDAANLAHAAAPSHSQQQKSNRYRVAGVENAAAFEEAFAKVQELVRRGQKEEVAEFIAYPLSVNTNGVKTIINSKEDFVKAYDTIFTSQVREALVNQRISETFVNYQGVMVGQGEIWFTQAETAGNLYVIYAINN